MVVGCVCLGARVKTGVTRKTELGELTMNKVTVGVRLS